MNSTVYLGISLILGHTFPWVALLTRELCFFSKRIHYHLVTRAKLMHSMSNTSRPPSSLILNLILGNQVESLVANFGTSPQKVLLHVVNTGPHPSEQFKKGYGKDWDRRKYCISPPRDNNFPSHPSSFLLTHFKRFLQSSLLNLPSLRGILKYLIKNQPSRHLKILSLIPLLMSI